MVALGTYRILFLNKIEALVGTKKVSKMYCQFLVSLFAHKQLFCSSGNDFR